MSQKERVLNQHEESPFYVCALKKAFLTKKGDKTTIEAFLERRDFTDARPLDENGMSINPWIKLLTKRHNPSAKFLDNQMAIFRKEKSTEIANNENPLRWVGSGALLILETKDQKRYAVLNKRHPNYAWGDFFDANGGLCSSISDMLLPGNLGRKELEEEVVIFENGRKVPFDKMDLRIIKPKHQTEAIVHFKGQVFNTKNLIIIIDSDTGTVDFRQIFKVKIKTLDNLIFVDGEERFTKEDNKVSQNRPTLLFNLDDLKRSATNPELKVTPVKGFLNGNEINQTEKSQYGLNEKLITPALREILKSIN